MVILILTREEKGGLIAAIPTGQNNTAPAAFFEPVTMKIQRAYIPQEGDLLHLLVLAAYSPGSAEQQGEPAIVRGIADDHNKGEQGNRFDGVLSEPGEKRSERHRGHRAAGPGAFAEGILQGKPGADCFITESVATINQQVSFLKRGSLGWLESPGPHFYSL